MAVGSGLGLAHVAIPYVETAIALSVLVLGLVVAIPRKWPVPAAVLLVDVFAVFHGHAHGTEMAETISAAQYGLGLLLATGLLHLGGIGLGLSAAPFGMPAQRIPRFVGVSIAVTGIVLLGAAI